VPRRRQEPVNVSDVAPLGPPARFALPLADEPFVATWDSYLAEARVRGAFAALRDHLPQLQFPVRAGVSSSEGYRAAVLRGSPPVLAGGATGLELQRPQEVELAIHPTPGGRVPILIVRERADFVTLVRALAMKNEPLPVPDSLGALAVSGLNNWDRIRGLRERWESTPAHRRQAPTWQEELNRIAARPELYQDRFILLSDGPYSGVHAAEVGMSHAGWQASSLDIRRDHECAHYLTWRLFGAVRNSLLDELLADYAGIAAVAGRFRADWFLRFIGLDAYPAYRSGGRLEVYCGTSIVADPVFEAVKTLLKAAAENLQRFDEAWEGGQDDGARHRTLVIIALASLQLEQVAQPSAPALLAEKIAALERRIEWRHG
jgi:hypothetical protein